MPAPENPDSARHSRDGDLPTGVNKPMFRSRLESIPVFEQASSVTVQVEILKESYDELMRLIEANEWDQAEGLTTVMLTGLGTQKGQLHLDAVNGMVARGDAHASKRVDDVVQELAAYHSMYSVMKFKAFKLYKLNQSLEFNNAGLRAQEDMWQEWADRMRREREQLNSELLRMRSLLAEFKLDWDDSGAPPLPPGVFASLRVKEREFEAANQPPPEDDEPAPTRPEPQERRTLWTRLKRLFGGTSD